MPDDLFYGADCEMRIAPMADATTAPAADAWINIPFVSFSANVNRERRPSPELGLPRHNSLDPVKPTPGFERVSADLTVRIDTRRTPLLLRYALGAPTTGTAVSGIYPHVWSSGSKTPHYFAIAIRTATNQVREYQGMAVPSLSLSVNAEQTQDFELTLPLRGLRRSRLADFAGDAPPAMVSAGAISRALFKVDDVAATRTGEATWTWDRGLAEEAFLSTTPTISELRPGAASMGGTARFGSVAEAFDDIEEGDTEFSAKVELLGTLTNHKITFEHPQAMLAAPPLAVNGPGLVERTVSWFAFQDASDPGARITVNNNVATYT